MHGFSMRMRFDDYDCRDRDYYRGCYCPPFPCYRYNFPDYSWYPRYYDYPYYPRYY